jgi:hypothetical protein
MLALITCLVLQVGKADVPSIAMTGGIIVGLTTIGDFEKSHTKGRAVTGGHPGGARLWRIDKLGAELYADGFNIGPRGMIFDTVRVDFIAKVGQYLPKLNLVQSELGLLARLHRGMSQAEVQRTLLTTQPLAEVTMLGLIRYRSALINKGGDDRFTTWTGTFDFGPHGLDGFTIVAD